MTFADVFTDLTARGVLSRAAAKKTSLRYLAKALGYGSLEACPVGAALREEATWLPKLEAHFAQLETQGKTISASTRRNTRNDLRGIFRLAEAHGLLPVPLSTRLLDKPRRDAFRLQAQATAPYRETYRLPAASRIYGLPQAQWPPDIAQGWLDYRASCPIGRRETTFRAHAHRLENYIGYLLQYRWPHADLGRALCGGAARRVCALAWGTVWARDLHPCPRRGADGWGDRRCPQAPQRPEDCRLSQ